MKVDSSWSDWSLGNAVGATQGMSASVRGLQNTVSGIANDPVGAFEQFANGVGYFARYPLTTIGNGWDSLVDKGGLSQAYALQGRHELAGAVTAEQATNFGISLLPGERLLALGKVGGATNALDGLVWHDAALGPKATGAVEVPATSAIARVGLRDDLAAQAGIPRDIGANPSSICNDRIFFAMQQIGDLFSLLIWLFAT
ncbi:hypothetical protein [Pseudomonas putida]|uniref:hypothetical protein n=1 Tax=Pseudomonas putida TaxID=303 RepID=UPI0040385A03